MHIADGYLSPVTVISSFVIAVPFWIYAFRKLKAKMNEETIPVLGALSALSFVIMMFNIPIPGGTSGHAVGAALIAIIIGPWVSFISISLVLLIQAVVFGDGGISALAVNSLSMGLVGSFAGYYLFKWLKNYKFAPFLAGYLSLLMASVIVAFVLGIQPMFWTHNGISLYFPFGLKVTLPMMIGGHLLFGIAEGIFTQVVYALLKNEKECAYEI
ncbi:MAG: cobalt transporter CbiM [Sulfurospirillaceae bacterium]|nr:cobalt transporter CbiM [Sulfurospirillaceae bacterium]